MRKLIVGHPPSVLRKARDSLNPKTWVQGALARDIDGRLVSPTSVEAVCWSAEGAIRRFCPGSLGTAILSIVAVEVTIMNLDPGMNMKLDAWNDLPGRTVYDVRDILLAAAKRLAAREDLLKGKKIF